MPICMGREVPAKGSGVHAYLQLHEFEAKLDDETLSQNQTKEAEAGLTTAWSLHSESRTARDTQEKPKKGWVWVRENKEQITEIKMNFDAGFLTDR